MSFHPGVLAGFPRPIWVPPVEPPEAVDPLAWALLRSFHTTSNTPTESADITIGGTSERTYLVVVVAQTNSGLGSATMPRAFVELDGVAAVGMTYTIAAGLASNARNMPYIGLHEVTGATSATVTTVPDIVSGTMYRSVAIYRIDAGNAKVVGLCADEKAGTAPLSVAVPGGLEQVGVGFAFHRTATAFSLSATTLENIDLAGSAGADHYGILASGDDISPIVSAAAPPAGTLNGLGVANFGRMAAPLVDHVLAIGDATATSVVPIELGAAAANRKVVALLGTSGPSGLSHRIDAAKITVDGVDYTLASQGDSAGGLTNRYIVQIFDGDVPAGTEGTLTLTRSGTSFEGWITSVFIAVLYGATLTNVYGGSASGSLSHNAGDHLLSFVIANLKHAHETVLANRLARMPLRIATTQVTAFEVEHGVAASAGSTPINLPGTGNNARVLGAAYAGSLTP